MSGRLKAVTIAVGILYAIGVLFFIAKANSRRNFVAVPDFIERDLAIPSDEFDMFALELDKYIVMDDGADRGSRLRGRVADHQSHAETA